MKEKAKIIGTVISYGRQRWKVDVAGDWQALLYGSFGPNDPPVGLTWKWRNVPQDHVPFDVKYLAGGGKNDESKMTERLGNALTVLARTPCSFWACEGPEHPKSMMTCTKCWAMRDIAAVKKRLEKMNL